MWIFHTKYTTTELVLHNLLVPQV